MKRVGSLMFLVFDEGSWWFHMKKGKREEKRSGVKEKEKELWQ